METSPFVFRWSPSAPYPSSYPSWSTAQVASASTSSYVLPVRFNSLIDCCASTGKTPFPLTAFICPAEAIPSLSPRPKENFLPRAVTGFVNGKISLTSLLLCTSRGHFLAFLPSISKYSPLNSSNIVPPVTTRNRSLSSLAMKQEHSFFS